MLLVRTYVEGVTEAVAVSLAADEIETWRAKDKAEAAIAKHMIFAGRAVRHETEPVKALTLPVGLSLEAICEAAVRATFEACGTRGETARVLGVSRGTVANYLGARAYKRRSRRRRGETRAEVA